MPLSRIAAAVTALTAIAILATAGAPSRTFLIVAAVVLLIAAVMGFIARPTPSAAAPPAEQPTTSNEQPTTPPKEGSVLVADIIADGTRLQEDMQRVLGSIVAD